MTASCNSISLGAFPMAEREGIAAFIRTQAFKRLSVAERASLILRQIRLDKLLELLTNPSGVVGLKWNEFVCCGEIHQEASYVGIYTKILKLLWEEFPKHREAMATAMRSRGHTNLYVARSPEALFPNQMPEYCLKNSHTLVDGWYVDTIIGRDRLRQLLAAAVGATSLVWGKDVIVRLRPADLTVQ